MSNLKVGIIGAGIVGLASAEQVNRILPNADITIVANKFGTDTTSDGAAGLFMPVLYGFRGQTEKLTRKYIEDSYNYYSNQLNKNVGIKEIDGLVLYDTNSDDCYCNVLSTILPIYRNATEEELLEYCGNWKHGTYARTLIIKGRQYMPLHLQRLKESGIKVEKKIINSFKELEDTFDVVVNCTGIGAAELCGDHCLKPVRGQVIKAKTQNQDKFILAGEDTYIIPFTKDVATLGGTHQFGYYSTEISTHDTRGILQRCSNFLPDLQKNDILWEWVGLRPYRHTVRVESEVLGKLKIVHNYGHGGCGITSAPGTSIHAALLVEDLLKTTKL